MQRSHLAAVLLACGVLGVVLVVQRSGERDPRVVLPVFAPRTTLILCCDAVQHLKLDSALRYGTGLLWAHEGVSEEDMTQCKALFKRSVVLKGGLLQLFDRFSADDDLVVFDTNVHGPTSTFVMHTLLKRHVRLELHTVVVKPVGTTLGSDSSRVAIMKKQHKAFKALVKRLKADGKIEAGFGYHPERMAARWRAIERSLDGMPGELKTSAKCIDWGSNAGFFSVKLAERFREGWVMGVEGEAVAEYADARRTHLEMAEKAGVDKNTHICNTKVSGAEFEKISDKWQLDVQLSLSVFHWFKIKNHEDFLEKLGFHLAEATTTFLELPEARVYGDNTGQAMADRLNTWYGGIVNEEAIVKKACGRVEIACDVMFLGSMFHDTGTVRTLLRVEVARTKPTPTVGEMQSTLKCAS